MNRTRVIVTGSRAWADRDTVWNALAQVRRELGPLTVVHGQAPGADSIAAAWVWRHRELNCITEPHPADWQKHGRKAGPIRNREMVDAGARLVLAFPVGDSPGTRGTMLLAAQAGIEVREYPMQAVSR